SRNIRGQSRVGSVSLSGVGVGQIVVRIDQRSARNGLRKVPDQTFFRRGHIRRTRSASGCFSAYLECQADPALKVAQWNVMSELVKWPPGAVGGIQKSEVVRS